MAVDLSSLNPEQLSCARSIEGPILLLAGAGTGKTKVITMRIAHMIECGVPPERIVAMTFTNKAANEMKERVTALVKKNTRGMVISTFHSFCLKILREFSEKADLGSHFSVGSQSDYNEIVRSCLEEKKLTGSIAVKDVIPFCGWVKNNLWTVEELAARGSLSTQWPFSIDTGVELFELYERRLRLNSLIDFDDCIYRCVLLFKKHPEVKRTVESRYTHVLVDEFQDTNFSQLSFLIQLCENNRNLCVVGDDDQSIYGWRGAMAEIMMKFEQAFPERQFIKLEQNYRCTQRILDAANQLIANNAKRKGKNLWTQKVEAQPIIEFSHPDEATQSEQIALKCMALLGQQIKPAEIAVLYRTKAQAKPLELALRQLNLRYKVYGGQSLFERREVKDILSYLQLSQNPKNRQAFYRIINTPPRSLGTKSLELIESAARKYRLAPLEVLNLRSHELPRRVGEATTDFVASMKILRSLPLRSAEDIETLAHKIIELFKLAAYYKSHSQSDTQGEKRIDNLLQIPGWLAACARRSVDFSDSTHEPLTQFFDQLMLGDSDFSDNDSNKKEQKNEISLMTIHSAKGLEFKYVFIAGVEEDLLPHKNSKESPQGVEEERRLMYVALTRAKEQLYLHRCRTRALAGTKVAIKRSRFLSEVPDSLIERSEEAIPAMSEDERKARTKNKLSALRAGLTAHP